MENVGGEVEVPPISEEGKENLFFYLDCYDCDVNVFKILVN